MPCFSDFFFAQTYNYNFVVVVATQKLVHMYIFMNMYVVHNFQANIVKELFISKSIKLMISLKIISNIFTNTIFYITHLTTHTHVQHARFIAMNAIRGRMHAVRIPSTTPRCHAINHRWWPAMAVVWKWCAIRNHVSR